MRRRRVSSVALSAFSRTMQDIPEDEQRFIKATELGDLGTIRALLEDSDEVKAGRFINCINSKDLTILEIATENEHLEIVEFFIDNWARMLNYETVHECIMLAISKGYIRIILTLLKHPVYQRNRGTLNRLGTITNYYQRVNHSKFDQDLTPLMLAAHCNEVDIIRIFLERGETIKKPHVPSCQCNYCRNRRKFDPLKHSKSAIHTYKALASPAYISLTSRDPILTAFLLSKELSQLARTEKEFKNEYRELSSQCKQYTSDLLDMCQNSKEVSLILNQEATTMEQSLSADTSRTHNRDEADNRTDQPESYQGSTLERLKLALRYNQKQFVAHPHCQHHLATIWYNSFPGWRQLALPVKAIIPLLAYISCPIWAFIYWFAPSCKVSRVVSTPLVKFATHTVAYLCFLLALFLQSVFADASGGSVQRDLKQNKSEGEWKACQNLFGEYLEKGDDGDYEVRMTGINAVDKFIILLLVGMFWGEVKQIWGEGYRQYLSSVWNWIDICMLNLYFGSYYAKTYANISNDRALSHVTNNLTYCSSITAANATNDMNFYYLIANREYWSPHDPIFICEALFAFANVLSFSRLSYILPINEFLGPLQISLGRMIGDILRFGAVFTVVFLAFFCSFLNLYWFLGGESEFGTFFATLQTLFWSLFGMAERTDTVIGSHRDRNTYAFTSTVGALMFAAYHIIMSLVMLNMLIAMMANSFEEIEGDEDVEWKFARAKLWMSYFEKGATIPVPFNIVPSPKSFLRAYQWMAKPISRRCCKRTEPTRRQNIHLNEKRKGVYNIVTNNDTTIVERLSHQNIMKAIVRRYLFQLQRSKESDEVNEGELDEIKNDISSLRFELLEMLTTSDATARNMQDSSGKPSNLQNGAPKSGGIPLKVKADVAERKRSGLVNGQAPAASAAADRPIRFSGVSASLADGDKKKLENIERKVGELVDEFTSMKSEIFKIFKSSLHSTKKSVEFEIEEGEH